MARLETLRDANAPAQEIANIQRQLRALPNDAAGARKQWESDYRDAMRRSQPPTPHAQAFPATAQQTSQEARNNFIALVLVLMIGTAGCPMC